MNTQIKTNLVGTVTLTRDVLKTLPRISYEEYLACSNENKFVEWVNGEVIPRRHSAEFYRLNRDGHYDRAEIINNVFRSQVLPGFWLHTDWLWQKFPNALAALDEMVGLEKLARQFKKK